MAVSAKVATAYIDLVARTESFKAAINEATAQTKKASAEMRASMAEAKGSIALLGEEMGVSLPRHLRTFVAGLPGVANAMSAAFDAVAVIALADFVFKAGEKVVEFASKNEAAAKKNAQAWDSIATSIGLTNDGMRVANDKLEDTIAKLEHKPKNALKDAMDEAIQAADVLSQKIDENLGKLDVALKENGAGMWEQFKGHASTKDIEDRAQSVDSNVESLREKYSPQIASARANKDSAQVQDLTKKWHDELKPILDEGAKFANEVLKGVSAARAAQAKGTATGFNSFDMDLRGRAAAGMLATYSGTSEYMGLTDDKTSDTKKADKLQQSKEATDAASKADADRLRAFETTLAAEKVLYTVSSAEEQAYWQDKISKFTKGSQQYLSVTEKYQQAHAAEERIIEAARKSTIGVAPEFDKAGVGGSRGENGLEAMIARNEEAQARLNATWTEAHDKLLLMTGAITPHQAALDLAAAHTTEYRVELEALGKQLAALHENDALAELLGPDKQNQAKQQGVQTQIDQLTGKKNIQAFLDAQATLDTTWHGMVDSVFDELIKKSQDTQQQIQHIALQMIDSINGELAKGMTGHGMDFGKIFEQASQQLSKTALEKIEGLGAQALGFGGGKKADGSAENPFHVVGPGGVGGNSSGIAGAASKGVMGMLNDSDWFSSLFGGKLFGSGSAFGGGHALGGAVPAGIPIDVGELGRERFTPMVPGRITPHNQMGGGQTIMHIDARGTDPALTQANFARALQATHARAVGDATRAMAERSRRTAQ